MNIQLVGIKDFRQNISSFVKKARSSNRTFVVTSHNKPLFEIKPFQDNYLSESLLEDIREAKNDIKKGRLYSQKEILKKLS